MCKERRVECERKDAAKTLDNRSRTKNVTAKKRALLGGPSDRIGSNYTPTAK